MALDNPERLALQQDLVDGLGRQTADRLMAQLPQVDWSQLATKDDLRRFDERFDLIDKQFKLVHDEFKLVHDEFKLVRGEIKVAHDDTNRRLDLLDQRFDDVHPIVEGKVYAVVRSHFFGLVGVLFAFVAATVAVVGMTLAIAD